MEASERWEICFIEAFHPVTSRAFHHAWIGPEGLSQIRQPHAQAVTTLHGDDHDLVVGYKNHVHVHVFDSKRFLVLPTLQFHQCLVSIISDALILVKTCADEQQVKVGHDGPTADFVISTSLS